jgi:hypothetical protein
MAGIETARVVEGAVGGVLVIAVLVVAGWQILRWIRARQRSNDDPGIPALARFVDATTVDPLSFGGGAWSARVRQRRDTVTYGYLAVAEEFESDDSGGYWCTLTLTLPGKVPFLVLDNRSASGRSGVPMEAPHRATLDDPPFDATYIVGSAEVDTITRVLGPSTRDVLLRAPVQRLMLSETQLLLRTFDGVALDEKTITWLDGLAARFLASTPSFVAARIAVSPAVVGNGPLPEGRYGPD